jgi:LPXTG-motif cell wall-anchored protein
MSILALGVLMSTTGGALALSNLTGSQSAGDAVYGDPSGGGVGGETGSGGGGNTLGGGGSSGSGSNGVAGESASGSTPSGALDTADQRASNEDGTLPFTGYAAIPLLLIGVALLGTGLVLRRRNNSPQLS